MFGLYVAELLAKLILFFYVVHFRVSKFRNGFGGFIVVTSLSALVSLLFINASLREKFSVEVTLPTVIAEKSLSKEFIREHSHGVSANSLNKRSISRKNLKSTWVVSPGQTLGGILNRANIVSWQMDKILSSPSIKKLTIYPNMEIFMFYDCEIKYSTVPENGYGGYYIYPLQHDENRTCLIKQMRFDIGNDANLDITFENSNLTTKEVKIATKKIYRAISGTVEESLYSDSVGAGVPSSVVLSALKQYSYILDFQRDVHRGDAFTFLFEEVAEEESGKKLRNGNLLYASFSVNGLAKKIYLFKGEYYNEKGDGIKQSLLRTPIDGARISSIFGRRRHPVLGYTRAHQGVDFAAPTGTPIQAAGDGIVEFIGTKSGYGNVITIRHGNKLKTNYAHMHRFAVGIFAGARVKQRQIIGQVGSTGLATGPHLHFEVVLNGKKVNPKGVYMDGLNVIAVKDRLEFKRFVGNVNRMVESDA